MVSIRMVGLAGLATTVAVAGCSSGTQPAPVAAAASALVVVVGGHANAAGYSLVAPLAQVLDPVVQSGAAIAVVTAGGRPQSSTVSLRTGANNAAATKRQQSQNAAAVRAALTGARVQSQETNPLAAIGLAARTLPAGGGTVLVVESGLSTTAPLRFQDLGVLEADPDDVAASLAESGELPTLTGVTVMWSGMGDVAEPQPALSQSQTRNLNAIWTAVLTKAGAVVQIVDDPLTGAPANGLPAVTVVPVGTPVTFTAPTKSKPVTVDLTQRSVAFGKDSAELADPAAARKVLEPLAKNVIAAQLTVTLTGTAATSGTPAGRRKLSLQRASAIKDQLVSLGVDPATITVRATGSDGPDHITDLDANGNLIPGAAAMNRKVSVTFTRG